MFPRTPEGEIDREKVCQMLVDLLPAYATGAANEDEARFVAAALPLCPDGEDELVGYYDMLAVLPGAMPPPDGAPLPVAALLERIARDDAQQEPHPRPLSERRGVTRQRRNSAVRRGVPARAAARHPNRPWGSYALVALALLAFGASNLYWAWEYSRVRTSTDQLVNAQQQLITQLQLTLTPAPTQPPAPQVLTSQHRSLTPTTTLDGMQGIFIWSEEERVGTLYVAGMPALESGRAYQLWLMREEGTVAASLGVFTVDAQGAATLVFESAEPIASFSDIGISIEPFGGSPEPTTPNVAVASI